MGVWGVVIFGLSVMRVVGCVLLWVICEFRCVYVMCWVCCIPSCESDCGVLCYL